MLGLFGPKKPGATALKSVEDETPSAYSGSGFDPTGLERAAKAAKEIDSSPHAKLAFEVIQQQEAIKQLEHATRQAAYEMQARQYEASRVQEQGEEARKTLEAQTEHAKRQAQYADELERQRYAAQMQAEREVREAALRREEESARRREELRRKTAEYEAKLREKTELARAKAEAEAKAQADRANHDLSLERMRVEMKERRETLLASLDAGLKTVGDGARAFLADPKQMTSAVGLASALAFGIYGARAVTSIAAKYVEARLGKPNLVRETSRATPLAALTKPGTFIRQLTGGNTQRGVEAAEKAMDGVVLAPDLEDRLRSVATATANTKANNAPFRHLLLYGPPGTGKTLFAKKLAKASGLDYAIVTGGDVAPLGRDASAEIHKLFDWAKASNRGLLLFIDEADAFLRHRASKAMSEDLRNAFNAFLYRTGDATKDFMLVCATNQPSDFDVAVTDRVDEVVEFTLPDATQRERLLRLYLDLYLGGPSPSETFTQQQEGSKKPSEVVTGTTKILIDGITDQHLKAAVEATEGFSGREISKLVIAWQAAAYGTKGAVFAPATFSQVLDHHVSQRHLKAHWAHDHQALLQDDHQQKEITFQDRLTILP